jgi:uncharacterized protein (DUF169 family)
MTLSEIHAAGAELEQLYCLRTAPLAIRLVDRDEAPEGCTQPSAQGVHYALCQAFSYVRRTRKALAMFPEDNWCLWPIINFRQRSVDEQDAKYIGSTYFIRDPEMSYRHFREEFPYIDEGKKKEGLAVGPLESCAFEPDAVMIYCGPSQLRQLLMASKYDTGNITQSSFDTCDSCGAALVPVLNGEKGYNVSMPDAGEYERGLCTEDDMIYTISGANIEPFIGAVRDLVKMGFSYKQLSYDLRLEYRRAPFYNDMFRKWGLETGEEWTVGKR